MPGSLPAGAQNATPRWNVCFPPLSIYHLPSTTDPFSHNSNHSSSLKPFKPYRPLVNVRLLAFVAQIKEHTDHVCRLCSWVYMSSRALPSSICSNNPCVKHMCRLCFRSNFSSYFSTFEQFKTFILNNMSVFLSWSLQKQWTSIQVCRICLCSNIIFRAPICSSIWTHFLPFELFKNFQPLWPCPSLCFILVKISGNGIISISASAQISLLLLKYLCHWNMFGTKASKDTWWAMSILRPANIQNRRRQHRMFSFLQSWTNIASSNKSPTQRSSSWSHVCFLACECLKLTASSVMFFSVGSCADVPPFWLFLTRKLKITGRRTHVCFLSCEYPKCTLRTPYVVLLTNKDMYLFLFEIFNLNT